MNMTRSLQRSINTMINQAVDNAPYDKTRVGTVLERNDDNTYTIKVDGVIYRKISTVNGFKADIGDVVKVVIPTNNPSQMFISAVRYITETILIGEIKQYAGSDEPNGWLKCDGRAISRTTYSALFNVIGTTYGTGDGSTTFNLPDMRDRFPVGAGDTYNEGDTGGEAEVTLTDDEMPAHTHGEKALSGHLAITTVALSSTGSSGIVSNVSGGTGQYTGTSSSSRAYARFNINASHEHSIEGGDQPHENRPPYIGINFLIYVGGGIA